MRFHDSQAYGKMDVTRERIRVTQLTKTQLKVWLTLLDTPPPFPNLFIHTLQNMFEENLEEKFNQRGWQMKQSTQLRYVLTYCRQREPLVSADCQ